MSVKIRVFHAVAGFLLLAAGPPLAAAPAERAVTFTAADGVTLFGTLFGEGAAGVVLAHMFPTDQRSWHPFARQLAAEGYRALAFDFRGFGRTGGTRRINVLDRDVRAAAAFLRAGGVQRIVLVGASMGGMAAIKVAAEGGVDALIVLSSPRGFGGLVVTPTELARLSMPSLWITSADDEATPDMRAMHAGAGGAKTLHVYPGSAHGTFIFDTPHGPDLTGRMAVFIARRAPPR